MDVPHPTLRTADLAHCRALLAAGSKSFSMAAMLLPRELRNDAAIFYAFCRVADDLVDEGDDPLGAHRELVMRLDGIYADNPAQDPVDRSLHWLIVKHDLPRAPLDALLEGFAWDAQQRDYANLSQVLDYSARVASAVGVVMTMLMGVRDPQVLARACDLGAAMQLTNIARDVAEDARRGRCYLPTDQLRREGIEPEVLTAKLQDSTGLRATIASLLSRADELYSRSEAGLPYLPARARAGIYAARLIYCDIGRVIREQQFNALAGRAVVGRWRKLRLAFTALLWSRRNSLGRRSQRQRQLQLAAAPLEEMRFLLAQSEAP